MADTPEKDTLTEQMLGRTFGACTIQEKIASGGFGTVFKAMDVKLGVPRAIKIFHPHLASERGFRSRFEAEVRTLAQLDHANIVRILYTLEDPDVVGYVMEYVPGKTLKRQIKEAIRLPPGKVAEFGAQIAEAVHHAHTLPNPVVHRDLSPENVLVRPDGAVKVTDFGIAKVLGEEAVAYTGAVVGKPRYMSPEQFEGFVSASCDVYALGVMLYEMATGRPPYDASTHVQYYLKHRDTAPPAISSLAPEIPWKLERAILRTLAKRPAQRTETMRAAADELRLVDALLRAGPALLLGDADRKAQAAMAAGFALFEAGKFDEAVVAFQEAAVHDPGCAPAS
ncbi:MAG: serine/threonine protein kinase, partial [Planctomycetes bacterium]|nr:serine/threonine protein kinase [Planctomycetota bacterium]